MNDSHEQFGGQLSETARVWRNKLDQRLRPLGLSQAKWMAILYLSKQGDGLMQRELANLLGIEGASLVGLLDRMAHDGWIERREHPEDRRCKSVHLTEQAHAVSREIKAVAGALRRELLDGLSPDEIQCCTRVLAHIKQRANQI
ncbi:MarR family winged helix-turn-helix transcriptional regulator [Acidihalobacter prosperus]|uniref:HTH marR-type domain-containing protein n=1 Tax=Acidihalobacter prosperus TaxID=160660 RepID=A0A1A6C4R2_9GAMM|nr:MarR family transcriptional regulator [Acidihalobacter prosperus]OBS09535.1 hypothetical protein Thpro_021863 [Acidihalobacter prosperus]